MYSGLYFPMYLIGVGSRVLNVERQMSSWLELNTQLRGLVGCSRSVSPSVEEGPGVAGCSRPVDGCRTHPASQPSGTAYAGPAVSWGSYLLWNLE